MQFLREILRGLVGVAGSHLLGTAALLAYARPVGLHPLATLSRGIAEAVGEIWWHTELWIDDSGTGKDRRRPETSGREPGSTVAAKRSRANVGWLAALPAARFAFSQVTAVGAEGLEPPTSSL